MMVYGPVAESLAELCAERWRIATGDEYRVPAAGTEWPAGVAADFEDVDVGIARTQPGSDDRNPVCEVLELYLASIRAAERYVYIENQYLTSEEIARALIARMRDVPELEVLTVSPRYSHGWLEARAMGAGKQYFMRTILSEGLGSRIRFLWPWVGSKDTAVMVHAKLMIVDDRLLRVGSSNLNKRSMGVDTECDLVIEAANDETRRAIRSIMCRLLGEHLGLEPEDVDAKLAESGSLVELADSSPDTGRGLAPIELRDETEELSRTLRTVVDPEEPIRPSEFLGDMFGARKAGPAASRLLRITAVGLLLLVLGLLWSYSPLAEWAEPEAIMDAAAGARGAWWIYPLVLAAYVAGGLVLFPVTVLIAVTGMLLGPWIGWPSALAGSMLSAWIGFEAGVWTGGGPIRRKKGGAFRRIANALKKQGVLAVAALRLVPVAPFTVVNMAMGAAGVEAKTFLAGSLVGLLPGTFVLTMLGDRLREVWRQPELTNFLWFAVVILAWLGLAWALQKLVARLRSRGR
jgi:phospholipase D1/2